VQGKGWMEISIVLSFHTGYKLSFWIELKKNTHVSSEVPTEAAEATEDDVENKA
jgi:hypothetical protein